MKENLGIIFLMAKEYIKVVMGKFMKEVFALCSVVTKDWVCGKRQGKGVMTWPNGKKYEGGEKSKKFR